MISRGLNKSLLNEVEETMVVLVKKGTCLHNNVYVYMEESMSNEVLIQHDVLERFITELFEKAGMGADAASITSQSLVKTNLWGVDSHGVLRVPVYIKRVQGGAINPEPAIKTVLGGDGPVALLDGGGGMGFVLGMAGIEKAQEQARKFGIGLTLVRNSNHFGAAALYTRMAAENGLIGIATTNVIPNIGMKGNKMPSVGNNPIAMAAPTTGEFPFVLDISLSSVAGGKLLLAAKKGEKIPTDWAVTKEGEETDDPQRGFDGFLLPTGLHKGYGLALFVDLITGLLSGGPFLQGLKSMYKHPDDPSLTTHTFICIDPEYFMKMEEYNERITEWVKMVHDTPMTDEGAKQVIPGEIEYNLANKRRVDGIPLPVQLVEEFEAVAAELGVQFTLKD